MASVYASVHVSTNPLRFLLRLRQNFIERGPKLLALRPVSCSSSSSTLPNENRRSVSISILLVSHLFFTPYYAIAGSILDKYLKRKKLDPLEVYLTPVILTQFQIKDLEKYLEADKPQYDSCRSLLRSGPAASLRVNIRAVAQYASDSGNGKSAYDEVDQCLRALEELDSILLHASRNDPKASLKSMKENIAVVLDSLDGLLKTVPLDLLDKVKAIADSYRNSEEDTDTEIKDPELKQLESIF